MVNKSYTEFFWKQAERRLTIGCTVQAARVMHGDDVRNTLKMFCGCLEV